jgi:Helix-turn-helix domain
MSLDRRRGRPERPIDPDTGAIAAFACALRRLREDAGSPTYTVLAQRTGLSSSTLSEATRGRRLASWNTVEAFIRACGDDPQPWRTRWEAVARQEAYDLPDLSYSGSVPPARDSRRRMLRYRQWGMLVLAVCMAIAGLLLHWKFPANSHGSANGSNGRSPSIAGQWVRIVGPGCPSTVDGAQVDVDPGWKPAGSGWTGDGCDGRSVTTTQFGSPTQWDKTVGWAFEPYGSGAPATCRLDVYIPANPDATGIARYRVLGRNIDDPPIKKWVPVRQSAHRGSWVTLGTYDFPQGVVNLELYNIGPGTAYIDADAARAACT